MANSPLQIQAPTPLTEEQLERWRGYVQAAEKDPVFIARIAELDKQRPPICAEMQGTLQDYLNGTMSSAELRSVLQAKTMQAWSVSGLKGIAGAMLLNQLVKQISPDYLDVPLRAVLCVPAAEDQSSARMQEFYTFAEGWRTSHGLTKNLLQTSNIPFFVSAWWHIQNTQAWPQFYVSGRNTLQREGLYTPIGKPVADYFAFRARFCQLQQVFNLSSWHLEQVCARLDGGTPYGPNVAPPDPKTAQRAPLSTGKAGGVTPKIQTTEESGHTEEITHSQVQWMLAKIAQKLGLKSWIAENDRNRTHNGEKLGALSIPQLPNVGLDPDTQKTIRLIDVLWIKGQHQIVAAFEVEHTTSIFSGLLRMSDLVAVYPNISFPLYIVAPASRMDLVRRQLRRPTFQGIGLHERCSFFSDEALFSEYPHIMKWAASLDAIEKQLAQRVGNVQEGEPADWLED